MSGSSPGFHPRGFHSAHAGHVKGTERLNNAFGVFHWTYFYLEWSPCVQDIPLSTGQFAPWCGYGIVILARTLVSTSPDWEGPFSFGM